MYEQYFGFTRTPFRLESEPDMFFFGESQINVLECIKISLSLRKGIITLSGLPGTGKTTVMRRAIEESIVPDTIICRINRARTNHFLDTLKREILARQKRRTNLTIEDVSLHQLVENAVKEEKHFLVVIDESQQLTKDEVDELFSLVSIEKDSRKYFKFLLVSHQPFHEYFDVTQYTNSDVLLSTHCFLLPLLQEEILPYIEHRLANTGWDGTPEFSKEIEHLVFMVTQGIPRRINSFFDRLMLFSFFEQENHITEVFVKSFCQDLLLELDAQSHPDLDSFDLRQALRRGRRHFIEAEPEVETVEANELITTADEFDTNDTHHSNKNDIQSVSDEPLASDDPEALILFVSRFIKNPERYKNYTDQYYKLPKNLTLLLCLATETDRYIEDITPDSLSASSATDIKCMIAIFIEKMLITSRFDKHRVLGLDNEASEDEINRHFSYMMRLYRSEYVKSEKQKFEKVIKNAYIKLLSERNTVEEEIPVVNEVLSTKTADEPVVENVTKKLSTQDESKQDKFKQEDESIASAKHAQQKLADLENTKRMLTDVSINVTNNDDAQAINDSEEPLVAAKSMDEYELVEQKKSLVLPLSIASFVVAASVGYVFFGTNLFSKPAPQITPVKSALIGSKAESKNEPPQLILLPELAKMVEKKREPGNAKSISSAEDKSKIVKPPKLVATINPVKDAKLTEVVVFSKKTEVTQQKEVKPKAVTKAIVKAAVKVVPKPKIAPNITAKPKVEVAKKPKQKPITAERLQEIFRQAERITKEIEKKKSGKTETVNAKIANAAAGTLSKTTATPNAAFLVSTGAGSALGIEVVKETENRFDNKKLERLQLDRIINNFKDSYENANIEELSSLFADEAVTNNGFTRDQIVEDYETVFLESSSRTIRFSNLVWDISNGVATGTGRFLSTVEGTDDSDAVSKEGRVSIKVVGQDDEKQIIELFFLHQLAEIE